MHERQSPHRHPNTPRRTPRRLVLAVVGLVALGSLVPAATAHADDLVSLVGGTKRSLSATPNPTVSFPIELTEIGAAAQITASVTEVLRGDVALATDAVGIAVATEDRQLSVTVADAAAFAPAAEYTVTVLLADAGHEPPVGLADARSSSGRPRRGRNGRGRGVRRLPVGLER